ncbi:MAG TPA: restriction endonuclease [Acidobacteriaceae bacterium]|nr:restriction endonuclease [Acidobacteriaceae bacterium]
MAIPDYQTVMLPLLRLTSDGGEHQIREAVEKLANQFSLNEEERKETLPSGGTIFDNRVGWARTYLKKAGLLCYPKRTYFQITQRGQEALRKNLKKIDVHFLRSFPEFCEFQGAGKDVNDRLIDAPASSETPEELLAAGYLALRKQLESDLLVRLKACSPDFFEKLVIRLLTTMGYGGSLTDAGKAIGKTADGGVDGVIKEDKLGLELLFIQAKRWDNNVVGRPEIQKFVGALHGQKAKKGIFLTTSTFSKEARDYAGGLDDRRVILIDGTQLAELMFDYGIGVSTINGYLVKRIDSDFFEEVEVASE